MSAENNKAIVRKFIEEFQTNKRAEIFEELIGEDFVDHSALPGIPSDKAGLQILFGMLWNAFGDFRAEVHDQVAEGDKITTRKTFFGDHTGDFLGVPATGRPIQLGVIDILTVRDGHIREHWCQVDMAGLMQQIS